jgi:hypothetical protein
MKTVDSTITITRDGISVSTPLKAFPYGKFIALQVALSAALSQLCTVGALRVAAMVAGATPTGSGGGADVRFELRTDHGAGGSEFVVGYSGLSVADADMITAALKAAANSVLQDPRF